MLGKAQEKKEHFENSNKKLKDFIQKIRDFLMGTAARPGATLGFWLPSDAKSMLLLPIRRMTNFGEIRITE